MSSSQLELISRFATLVYGVAAFWLAGLWWIQNRRKQRPDFFLLLLGVTFGIVTILRVVTIWRGPLYFYLHPDIAADLELSMTLLLALLIISASKTALRHQLTRSEWSETERKYRLLAETGGDVVMLIHPDQTLGFVSPAAETLFGLSLAKLIALEPQARLERLLHPEDRVAWTSTLEQSRQRRVRRLRVVDRDGFWRWVELTVDPIWEKLDGAERFAGWKQRWRDVNEEVEAIAEAERRALKQAALASLTQEALRNPSLNALLQHAAQLAAETLRADLGGVHRLDEGDQALDLVAAWGWHGPQVADAVGTASLPGAAIEADQTFVLEHEATETRFALGHSLRGQGMTSGIAAVIHDGAGRRWGALAVYGCRGRRWSATEAAFVENMAGVLAGALARHGLDELKQHMVAVVAHELKTPITVLKGHAQTLKRMRTEGSGISAMGKIHVNKILAETEQLEQIIDELLQLDRAGLGLLSIDRRPTDLAAVARDCAERIETIAGDRVKLILPSAPVIGAWDQARLGLVLVNLLDNAVKYSKDLVTLEIAPTNEEAVVTVRDQGDGITAYEQEHIFDAFYRGPRSRDRASGLGIGLAISKAIVMLHQGAIEVDSKIGVGTTMRVRLPYGEELRPAPGAL